MKDSTVHTRIIQTVRCPVCRTVARYDVHNPFRPFCSERCRLIDLGQWLEQGYCVAGDPVDPEPHYEEDS